MWTQHDIFVATLRRFHGVPYVWSGGHQGSPYTEAGGVDCSGLIRLALIDARVRLPAWDSNSQGCTSSSKNALSRVSGCWHFLPNPVR